MSSSDLQALTERYGEAIADAADQDDADAQLAVLEAARDLLGYLDGRVRTDVVLARKAGATWQEVADSLGLKSRQAAEARYG